MRQQSEPASCGIALAAPAGAALVGGSENRRERIETERDPAHIFHGASLQHQVSRGSANIAQRAFERLALEYRVTARSEAA